MLIQFARPYEIYDNYLESIGVDLTKVRYTELPIFQYSEEEDIVNPNYSLGFFNGKYRTMTPVTTSHVTESQWIYNDEDFKNEINDSKLGIVIYLEELVKFYNNGSWHLCIRYLNLDKRIPAITQL